MNLSNDFGERGHSIRGIHLIVLLTPLLIRLFLIVEA